MARARNVKPGFFRNADLVELPFQTRLLFIGLWTIADRAGRLEDRPKQIKMEIFPADDVDCDKCLSELESIGVISRYEAQGVRVIQVVNFLKHQNPHRDEKKSTLPELCCTDSKTVDEPTEHHANTVQAPYKNTCNTAESLLLIPDSLLLNPEEKNIKLSLDSLRPDDEGQEDERHTPQLFENLPESRRTPAKPSIPDCPHLEILNLWAEVLPTLPQHLPQQWRGARSDHLRARWKEKASEKGWTSKEEGLAYFRTVFELISESSFLCGRAHTSDPSRRPFQATLEWVVLPGNWAKVLEQRYNDRVAA